jgi:hypothetical protein
MAHQRLARSSPFPALQLMVFFASIGGPMAKTKGRKRQDSGQDWKKAALGGVVVAAFAFAAPIAWEAIKFRGLSPQYVKAVVRIENNVLLLLVRNSSNEPLDLVEAEIEIPKAGQTKDREEELGAYPSPSYIYRIDSKFPASMIERNDQLVVRLRIAQIIKAGDVDQFGISIQGPDGPLALSSSVINAKIVDVKGQTYSVRY